MANQTARNSGITGLFDLPGYSAKAQVRLTAFGQKQSVQTKSRRGRGQGKWAKARTVLSSGTLVVSGKIRLDAPPLMDAWKGQEGTVTLTATATKTQAVPVRITGCQFEFDEKTQDTWDFTASCEITDTPTWTGFGTLPSATDPSASDLQLWGEGTTKTTDPSGLVTAAMRTTDVWGSLPDTDSGEADRLATIVAAALAPLPDLQLRTATFSRDADDGGQVVEVWGLTTTAEDQTLPRTQTTVDPAGITSSATSAAINGSPAAPSGDNFLVRGTQTLRLNANKTLTVKTYGKTTSAQDIENPETYARIDVSGITSEGKQVVVFDHGSGTPAATVPAGLQKVSSATFAINPDKDKVEYLFAVDTPQQKAEQEESFTLVDPNGLDSNGAAALVDASPSVPGGYVEVGTRTKNLTHSKQLNVVAYGLADSKDKIEFAGTWYDVDPNALETEGLDTSVFTTDDGEPADPTPANGTKITGRKVIKLNRLKSQRVITLGLADSLDKQVNPRTTETVDPNGLGSAKTTAAVIDPGSPPSTPSAPSGYKFHHSEDVKLVDGTGTVRVYHWRLVDSADEERFKHTKTATDPNDLETQTATAAIFTTGSPPSAPSTPTGLKSAGTEDLPLTASGTTNKSVRIYRWAKRDSKDEIELGSAARPHTIEHTDPDGIESYAHLTKVDASPSVPSGLVLRGTDSIPYTQGTGSDHTITKIECGTRTPKDDHEMPHTLGRVDPLGEETTRVATVATCLSSDTAAALAATAFAANKSTASFAGVSVEKISQLRARTIIETAEDEGKHWHEGFRTFYDHVKGLPSDGVIGTTAAGVRVARLPGPPIGGGGGGYTEALLDFRQVSRETGTVWLRRRLIVTSQANLTTALHLDARGYVNDATFLGMPAKTLMYGVPRIRHLWPLIGGDHLVLVDYRWEYDNLGHPNEQMLNVGWTNTLNSSTLINTIGLVTATDYFASNMLLSWPGTWDMSFALP